MCFHVKLRSVVQFTHVRRGPCFRGHWAATTRVFPARVREVKCVKVWFILLGLGRHGKIFGIREAYCVLSKNDWILPIFFFTNWYFKILLLLSTIEKTKITNYTLSLVNENDIRIILFQNECFRLIAFHK